MLLKMSPLTMPSLVAIIAAFSSLEPVSARYLVGNRFNNVEGPEDLAAPPPVKTAQLDDEPPSPSLPSQHQESLIAMQFTPDPHAGRDRLEMIRNGELGLVSVRYVPSSFAEYEGGDDYTDVYGEFCAFDARLNKVDPPRYPTIKEIMSQSAHCDEHRYTIPLHEVMDAVNDSNDVRTVPLSGMLFHQGYSGAGPISNALAAFDLTLVVSEHLALSDALSACDVIRNRYQSDDCSSAKQRKLIRDVIALISRTPDENVRHLFLKLESSSAAYLPALRELYPDAKWTFSYRNAEETLSKHMQRKRSIPCIKTRRNPSAALVDKSEEILVDLEGLSHHEVCALHLSTLLDAAVREHERTGTGMLVSYDDILSSSSQIILDEVLPYLGLQGEMESRPELIAKLQEILSRRSNAHGGNHEWDKSQEEAIEISEEVHNAVMVFMADFMGESNQ